MSAIARVAREMRVAAMGTGNRAYHALRDAVAHGTEIDLTNHELVLGHQPCSLGEGARDGHNWA